MDFLELVQSLHTEAQIAGSAPTTVSIGSLTDRGGDLVRWVREAYNDIQRSKDGRWKWLRRGFTLDTVGSTASYAYADANDEALAAPIARFRGWDLDKRDLPFIYLASDGKASERELEISDWRDFRRTYVRGTHTATYPSCITADTEDSLFLGPTPDGIYRVTGNYWRSNQVLTDADDEPEMPADYHMLIVFRAMVKYGFAVIAQEHLARAETDGGALWGALCENQWYGRYSLELAGAIA